MKEQSLMDLFSDPNTIHSLSFGERMLGSTVTMIMGLGITFTILLLIWLFIAIMGKVLGAAEHKKRQRQLRRRLLQQLRLLQRLNRPRQTTA